MLFCDFCPLLLNGYKMTSSNPKVTGHVSSWLVSITNGLIDYVPAEEVDYDIILVKVKIRPRSIKIPWI